MTEGQDFTDRVAELLRAARYRVYGERMIAGSQVDLYAEHTVLDYRRRIAVECIVRATRLTGQEIDQQIGKYHVFQAVDAIDELFIITRAGITATASERLRRERFIQHFTLTELESLVNQAPSGREALRFVPLWGESRIQVENDYCFVLMPFGEEDDLQFVYRNHVKPVVVDRSHLRCERADDIYDIAGVMQSVWDGINRSRLVIAELTGRNPNVFYELGIAHTLGKPVILLSQSINDVPSDLRHLRCILYRYKPDMIAKFEDALAKTIASVVART